MFERMTRYILLALFALTTTCLYAQRDTSLIQEVEVVKDYNPTISDANKISDMPKIESEEHEKPSFNYSIFSQPVFNTFSVNPLKAATFASPPKDDTGFGLVKAGIGNYSRPYGELFFNSQNMKNTLFGLHGKHLSSHGKLTLEGGDRVDAPFSDNEAEMFVKHLFRNSVLSVNLGFDHQGFNYYGYPVDTIPGLLLEDDQDVNYLGSRQTFSKGNFNINLDHVPGRGDDLIFDFDFLYHYFGTKTGQREHFGNFTADVQKPMDKGMGFLKAGVSYVYVDQIFNRDLMQMGENRQIWLMAKPSYKLGGDVANLTLGVNGWFVLEDEAETQGKLAPHIRVNFVPVKEIINIYAGVDGNYINNRYSAIAYENPFVDPEHDVKNTFEQFHFFGGFDGKFATRTNFKISADYSMIKEKPLYYLFSYLYPGTDGPVLDNDFQIIYDNLDVLKFNLEIFHAAFEKMDLLISGDYYVYKMETMEEAWNLPEWKAKVALNYQVNDQLDISTDFFFTGPRKALIMNFPGEDPRPLANYELLNLEGLQMQSYQLETVFDMNFTATYQITGQFSVFARLHNFGFQKYQQWFGYPVQNFNVLGGLNFAF